eukprot:43124-Pyramimonas_sp.AAC.1
MFQSAIEAPNGDGADAAKVHGASLEQAPEDFPRPGVFAVDLASSTARRPRGSMAQTERAQAMLVKNGEIGGSELTQRARSLAARPGCPRPLQRIATMRRRSAQS